MLRDLVASHDICSLPWLHTEIDLQSNTVKPCCKYKIPAGNISDTFSAVWFNQLADLRKNFVNNIPVTECSACAVADDTFSYKKWKNKTYAILGFLNLDETKVELPRVFHIKLKNTCNLACRMCWPGNSSTFEQLTKKSDVLTKLYALSVPSTIDIESLQGSFSNARHITITGGEPLIDADCVRLIEMVQAESSELKTINFSSNFVKLNYPLLKALSKLNAQVQFSISLDGPPDIHEYIRVGCKWANIIKNINFVRSTYPRFKFAINSTISALNVGYVVEMLTVFHDLEAELNIKFTGHMTSPVLTPEYLHPAVIPNDVKSLYLEKLKSADPDKFTIPNSKIMIPTAVALLNTQSDKLANFNTFVRAFDKAAGTDINLTYPEFKGKL